MNLLYPFFLAAGLMGPGWLLGRVLRTPSGWIGSFIGSAVLLPNLVIGMSAAGIALNQFNLAFALGSVCLLLAITASSRARVGPLVSPRRAFDFRWAAHHWFLLPALIGLLGIAGLAWLNPLSGFDTIFRWDFLAQQMVRHETLEFYPAVTPQDFERYGWCDAIAPLISSLYFWSYIALGSIAPLATFPIVVLQGVLLFSAVYQLASRHHGATAGCAATAIFATTCVPLWGTAMGQETGLTALALTTIFLFLNKSQDEPAEAWLVWAGLAAAMGALAREYGLLFVAIGTLEMVRRRIAMKGWLQFLIPVLTLSGPWYYRTWVRTGNPLWPHDVFHLFPTNPIHLDYMRMVATTLRQIPLAETTLAIATLISVLCALPLLFGGLGFATHGGSRAQFAAITAVFMVWIWSINQTSGGYSYSTRVLTPAIALCAVAAGAVFARHVTKQTIAIISILLSAAAIDASARSFFLPAEPWIEWWRVPASEWFRIRDLSNAWNRDPAWPILAGAAGRERIVVTNPSMHAALAKLGARPVALFSPDLNFLFAPDAGYKDCIAKLRSLDVRLILLSRNIGIESRQLSASPFFRALTSHSPATEVPVATVYDVEFIAADLNDTSNPTLASRPR
ncbi:MAG: hypothetical protein ABIZ04_14395 [Opitutus sp.]